MVRAAVANFATLVLVAVPQVSAVHPIETVISLLEKLEVEAQKEGANEAENFQKMQHWCKRSTRMLERAIKMEKKAIESLTIKVDGLDAQVAGLDDDLSKINKDLNVLEQQRQKAQEMRDNEHAQFEEESDNLGNSVEAAGMALDGLADAEAEVFVQTGSHVQAAPEDLLKLKPGKGNPHKPKAKTFSGHQGGIIETFKGLEEDWTADKLSTEEEETANLQAYTLAKQARDQRIEDAEAVKSNKEHLKADAMSAKGQAEGELSEQQNALEADTSSLADTDAACAMRANEWDQRSATRDDEIKALKMAVQILSQVTGVRDPDTHTIPTKALIQATAVVEQDTSEFGLGVTHLLPKKALVQARARVQKDAADFWGSFFGPSFLQVDDPKAKVAALLRTAGAASHSKALEKLAEQIRTYDGPFDKIKKMMQKMSFRLMAEQKDEDDHKAWCDIEVDKSTEKKEEKESEKELLIAKTTEMDMQIKLMDKQVDENKEKIRELNACMAEETQLRTTNHLEIEATLKDSTDSQEAISEAIKVLTEFYKQSGMVPKEPWEFVQMGSRGVELPEQPTTWDSSYTGVTDPKSGAEGVLAVLEETLQKFSKMEADAKVADASDQKEYEEDMTSKRTDVKAIEMDNSMKNEKRDALEESLTAASLQLKATNGQLHAVKAYQKDLEPACGEGDSSYQDRKKARMDEVDALKKAEEILAEAFQQKAFLQQSA